VVRRTVVIALSVAGLACALTLVFLAMRSVMNVGGFCANGGPYVIRQKCPQGVPAILVGSIWGGFILAFVYGWYALKSHVPSFTGLLWPALFLSLGWNFLEYAFDAPGKTTGIVWGWLVCGVVFMLMGGLPLLVTLPATVRRFTRDEEHPPGWPAGMPLAHMQRVAATAQPTRADARFVDELERLAGLHDQGALADDEYEAAKQKLLGKDPW
jgi:Short C-terminal domain